MIARRRRPIVAAVQSLESRRLFALAGFEASFNFQPKDSDTPGGYVPDVGKMYGEKGDYTYGWDASNVGYMVNRHTEAKLRYDMLAYFGGTDEDGGERASKWEVAVPDGLYEVSVLAGDAKYTNSRYHILAEEQTVLNSKPNKARPWRSGSALVYVADGRLSISSGDAAYNNKINSVSIRQVDPHVTGTDLVNPFANAGIVQNEVDTEVAVPAMKTLGVKSVRLWYDVKDWEDGPDRKFLKYFKEHHQAGFSVTAIFDTPTVPTPEQTTAFFERMTGDAMAMESIDFWELGNEPNYGQVYWQGNEKQFVENFMKPAYEVIHAAGEPVIGGGVSYDVTYAQRLEKYGYSQYCDYAGFHPYGENAAIVLERAAGAKAAYGNKPMIITEWNVQFVKGAANWAEQVRLAAIGLAEMSYINYYFALATGESHVGSGGLIDAIEGTPNDLFYDVAKTWGAYDLQR